VTVDVADKSQGEKIVEWLKVWVWMSTMPDSCKAFSSGQEANLSSLSSEEKQRQIRGGRR